MQAVQSNLIVQLMVLPVGFPGITLQTTTEIICMHHHKTSTQCEVNAVSGKSPRFVSHTKWSSNLLLCSLKEKHNARVDKRPGKL